MATRTVLIVDDEPAIRDVVRYAVQKDGFNPIEVENGAEAVARLEQGGIDIVVLDIMMPEMTGLDVCKTVRTFSQVPILFLSSADDEIDRILSFEIGGDDYLSKPFSPRELTARLRAILKRTSQAAAAKPDEKELIQHGQLEIDGRSYEARWQGEALVLTATEFEILKKLAMSPGQVFSRGQLIDAALGENLNVSERTVDTHIKRIRKKVAPFGVDPILTVHGIGYRISRCE